MTAQLVSSIKHQSLPTTLNPQRIPDSIAIIMDGNGRWAKQKGMPRIEGHRQGAKTLKNILRTCKNWGIKTLTVYAFSTENWGRPLTEVSFLMKLFEKLLRKELQEMKQEGVCINFIGDLVPLPESLQQEIHHSITETQHNQQINFNVAINYGGRGEIIRACRSLAERVARGELSPESINEELISQHLYTPSQGDPDLLIRTSGEMRLSNFLLWQMAYTEIYVTDTFLARFYTTRIRKSSD